MLAPRRCNTSLRKANSRRKYASVLAHVAESTTPASLLGYWIAMTKAAMVKNDDFEALSKSGDLVLPERPEAAESGDEQNRKTHAVPLVIERAVTDRNPGHRCAVQSRCGSVPPAWQAVNVRAMR